MLAFLVAIVAGAVVPLIEGIVKGPLSALGLELEEGESRTVAFIVAMLGVGIVGWVWSSGSVFWVILGGALGLFGLRIIGLVRHILDQRGSG